MPMGPFRLADMSGLDTVVKVARDLREHYGDRFYVHTGWRSGSSAASSAPSPARASMSTAESTPKPDARIAERFALKAFVEACLVLEEGIAGVREIDLGLMLGTGMVPGPVRPRRLPRPRRRARGARARRAGVGRALRAAARAAPAGRPGAARRQERPGLLPLPAARARLRDSAGQARPPRRRRRRAVARQPAGELALAGGDRGARARRGTRSRAASRAGDRRVTRTRRCSAPAPTSRRSREMDAAARRAAARRARTRCCARSSARAR